jgi:iron complex outermembrane receptor protein
LHPTSALTLFGATTRGLEDSGVAPANAINRSAVLGATHSSQTETELKYAISPKLILLAGSFDITKPYFALDEHDTFNNLGQERHRGGEISLAGDLTSNLHVVAGALLMSPEVTATTAKQSVEIRPVAQPNRMEQLSASYSLQSYTRFSIDCTLTEIGNRVATGDNRLEIPNYATLDAVIRYQTTISGHPAVLRLQIWNITNA